MRLNFLRADALTARRIINSEYSACASMCFQGEIAQMCQEQDMAVMEAHLQVLANVIDGSEYDPEDLQYALEYAGVRKATDGD